QAFLERIIKQKDGIASYVFLHAYVDENRKLANKGYSDRYERLLAKRKDEAERLAREAEERKKVEENDIENGNDFEMEEPIDEDVAVVDEEIDEEVDIEIEIEPEDESADKEKQETATEEKKSEPAPAKAAKKPDSKKVKTADKAKSKPLVKKKAAKPAKPAKSKKDSKK
ncbi:MAG TPA: hypothetical protein PKK48_03995, partial [Phycisphaerae bacterium]|nr:hypothetical protein [Phycisphaerae bacterium]